MNHLRAFPALLAAAALALPAGSAPAQAPKVEQPWARPTVQGQSAGGAYLRVVGGSSPDRLVGADAAIAGRVELHSMSMDGQVMRMRPVDAVDVPAGRIVELRPGGLHLMLVDLKTPLKTGNRFPLTLRFERAGAVQVEVPVQPGSPPAPAGAEAGHPGGHRH